MKKVIITAMLLFALLCSACTPEPPIIAPTKTGDNMVGITIRSDGVDSDSSEVVVRNFYAGARAEMTYRIHNSTVKAIRPDIFIIRDADVTDYSKADGVVKAPYYVENWIEIPEMIDVNPGETEEFIVALQMPKKAEKPADKIGFQIGIANATGGLVQTAVGTWWLVYMR